MEILELLDPVRHDEEWPGTYNQYFLNLIMWLKLDVQNNTHLLEKAVNELH